MLFPGEIDYGVPTFSTWFFALMSEASLLVREDEFVREYE
jgi:hypothetical protein